jgi:hypothetical protein
VGKESGVLLDWFSIRGTISKPSKVAHVRKCPGCVQGKNLLARQNLNDFNAPVQVSMVATKFLLNVYV